MQKLEAGKSLMEATPLALREKPELPDHLIMEWEAFWTLSNSRPVGFGQGAIPFSEVLAYFQFMNITNVAEQEELLYLIRAMDAEYLDVSAEQQKAKEANGRTNRT